MPSSQGDKSKPSASSKPTNKGNPPNPPPANRVAPNNTNKPSTAPNAEKSTASPAWDIERFSLYGVDSNKEPFEFDSRSDEFFLVADVYRVARLAFLRSDSQRALEKLGVSCVNHWTSPKFRKEHPEYQWQGDKSKINEYVKTFTKGLKHTPPAFLIDPDLVGVYAAAGRRPNYEINYEVLRTRKLFRIKVPVAMVQSLKIAYDSASPTNDDSFQTLRFLLALSIWHELNHGFVMFMAGSPFIHTPPECSLEWTVQQQQEEVGESGDFMECEVWGGSVQITDYPNPARKTHGTLFAKDSNGADRDISINTIKAFVKKPISYDLKKDILAVKSRSPSPEPPAAKRRKVTATRNSEPKTKVVAWNVKFKFDMNSRPISIEKELASVA